MEISVGHGRWGYSVLSRRLSRLQPDCNSSDPLLGLPSRSQVGGPGLGAALLADRSAFVWLSTGDALSGQWSGQRCQHNSICPRCCQLWRKRSEQGLIISLGGTAGDCGRLDTERQFCTHRTSCPHPRLTLNTSYESINVYAEAWMEVMRLWKRIWLLISCVTSWHSATQLSHLFVFARTQKVALALSGPCPLFGSSCQNCQPYLPLVSLSWGLEEEVEKGGHFHWMSGDASLANHISGQWQ